MKSSFTLYYGLLSSIQSKWKITSIQKQRQTGNQNWYDNVENLSNAALHRIIVENKFQPPINEKDIFSYGVDDSDIHKIYNWPFLTTKNTKLIEGLCAKRAYIEFWPMFIFCRIELIFRRLTCFDMKSIVP